MKNDAQKNCKPQLPNIELRRSKGLPILLNVVRIVMAANESSIGVLLACWRGWHGRHQQNTKSRPKSASNPIRHEWESSLDFSGVIPCVIYHKNRYETRTREIDMVKGDQCHRQVVGLHGVNNATASTHSVARIQISKQKQNIRNYACSWRSKRV